MASRGLRGQEESRPCPVGTPSRALVPKPAPNWVSRIVKSCPDKKRAWTRRSTLQPAGRPALQLHSLRVGEAGGRRYSFIPLQSLRVGEAGGRRYSFIPLHSLRVGEAGGRRYSFIPLQSLRVGEAGGRLFQSDLGIGFFRGKKKAARRGRLSLELDLGALLRGGFGGGGGGLIGGGGLGLVGWGSRGGLGFLLALVGKVVAVPEILVELAG